MFKIYQLIMKSTRSLKDLNESVFLSRTNLINIVNGNVQGSYWTFETTQLSNLEFEQHWEETIHYIINQFYENFKIKLPIEFGKTCVSFWLLNGI